MNAEQQKVVQYLNEAEASERALVRVLRSQIAMTAASSCYDHATPSMARR